MPPAERIELQDPSGSVMADLQAGLATLGPKWELRQLVDISPEAARDDLARLSAAALSIVAQAARGAAAPVPEAAVAAGENAAAQFLIRWRGEADPRHVGAIDTYWVSAAEHGLNSSTFTARIAASTGADCAAALSAAVGALSGPLHGGAPTRVLRMLDEVEASDDPDAYVRALLDRGERIMGFGTASTGRGSAGTRPAPHGTGARLDPGRGGGGARARRARGAAREVARPRARDERRVLGRGRARDRRGAAGDVPGAVRLRPGRGLVGPHRRAAPDGPPDPALGTLRRCPRRSRRRTRDARRGSGAGRRPRRARRRARARGAPHEPGTRRSRRRRARRTSASGRWRSARSAQFRYRQKTELLRRGLDDPSPACRGSALISLELLSRDHPGVVNAIRPALHEIVTRDDNDAVRRLAVVALRNGSGQRDTIAILSALADDETAGRELRDSAAKVAQTLRRKAGPAR